MRTGSVTPMIQIDDWNFGLSGDLSVSSTDRLPGGSHLASPRPSITR